MEIKPGDIYVCNCESCKYSSEPLTRMICTPVIEGELVYMVSSNFCTDVTEPISLETFRTFAHVKLT